MLDKDYLKKFPDKDGYFGDYGGAFLPPQLVDHFKKISDLYEKVSSSDSFRGRRGPVFACRLRRGLQQALNIKFTFLNVRR
ncbi:MAG: hypothetical protein QGH60_24725 [Phycisphaerae bacterium]|jgi:hypothetical protein|nr:hypothetical protein [Phycisphaerae bacterium]